MNAAYQAGAIAVRLDLNRPKVLLVRPKREQDQWIFPKGHVEEGEDPSAAALRELREEAGVEGSMVRPIGERVSFVSKGEPVLVQYFLVERIGQAAPLEARPFVWCDPRAAITLLSHENAKQLLREALPFIDVMWPAPTPDATGKFQEFLLAEHGHVAESLLRNEEDGERRAAFFVTLVTLVGGFITWLATRPNAVGDDSSIVLMAGTLAVLLYFGILTLRRIVSRNSTSDAYKFRLGRVRRYFASQAGKDGAALPFDEASSQATRTRTRHPLGKGGWQETVVAANTIIAGAIVLLLTGRLDLEYRVLAVLAVCFLAWRFFASSARSWYAAFWEEQARDL